MEGAAYASIASDNTIAYAMQPLIKRGAAFVPVDESSEIRNRHLVANAAHYSSALKFSEGSNFDEHLIGQMWYVGFVATATATQTEREIRVERCLTTCVQLALNGGHMEALSYVQVQFVNNNLRCVCVAHGREDDPAVAPSSEPVSYTHLRAHETV